jgi:flagellar biosynthesis protein
MKSQAIALKWHPHSEKVPRLTAKGGGRRAEEIIRLAREHGIPIRQDGDLVQVFSMMNPGEAIPPEVHAAVAEILAFIYWSNQQYEEIFGKA